MNPTLPYPWAVEALRQAGRVTRAVQQKHTTGALTKADRSPVTAADFAAQAVVTAALLAHDPTARLVAEEDAAALQAAPQAVRQAVLQAVHLVHPAATWPQLLTWLEQGRGAPQGRFWVLDPVDGTKGFLRGAQYAVALALVDQGQVVWGGLACPNLQLPTAMQQGVLAVAARGQGAWVAELFAAQPRWRRARVSARRAPQEARLLRSYEAAHTHAGLIDALAAALGTREPPVRLDSQAKYALLATGQAEVYLRVPPPQRPDYREKIWDQAAGALLVEEAGGRVTDLDGKPLDFGQGRTLAANRGVLATNGLLHAAVLQALRQLAA